MFIPSHGMGYSKKNFSSHGMGRFSKCGVPSHPIPAHGTFFRKIASHGADGMGWDGMGRDGIVPSHAEP